MLIVNHRIEEDRHPFNGQFPGYHPAVNPTIYFNRFELPFCPRCASKRMNEAIKSVQHEEGPAIECSDCGRMLESYYGNPDQD